MNKLSVILVTGACGQIGTELVKALRQRYGREAVIATDRHYATEGLQKDGPYFRLDVTDQQEIQKLVSNLGVSQIYHLAATLSASGEKNPKAAWQLNMDSLLYILEVARIEKVQKVFFPSSIAVFGANTTKVASQHGALQPATVYGISKCAGEQWCAYYAAQYGLDVRSIRYPGLISHSAQAGGGTTDYAVEIFYHAISKQSYTCYLKGDTRLPMLYMPDAIRATIALMECESKYITLRSGYNLGGLSFTPAELAEAIKLHIPDFKIIYEPDYRQQIANSWPADVDDQQAKHDWAWQPEYDLKAMVADMFHNLNQPPNYASK